MLMILNLHIHLVFAYYIQNHCIFQIIYVWQLSNILNVIIKIRSISGKEWDASTFNKPYHRLIFTLTCSLEVTAQKTISVNP